MSTTIKEIDAYRGIEDYPNLKFEVKEYQYKNADYIGIRNPLTSQEWRLYFTSQMCCDHNINCSSESSKSIFKPDYGYSMHDNMTILLFDFEISFLDVSEILTLKYTTNSVEYSLDLTVNDLKVFKNVDKTFKNVYVECSGMTFEQYILLENSTNYVVEYKKPIYYYEYISVNSNMYDIKDSFSLFDGIPFDMYVENNNLFFISKVKNKLEFVYKFCGWRSNVAKVNSIAIDHTKKNKIHGHCAFIGGCTNPKTKVLVKREDLFSGMKYYKIGTKLTHSISDDSDLIGKPLKLFSILGNDYPYANCSDRYYTYGAKRIKIDDSDNYVSLYIDESDGDEIEMFNNKIEFRKRG